MIHLGDITKINGYEVPIVDCVIGGSPCQDLSIAGKRAGLAGERSGLYIEEIRLIKEMREQYVRNHKGSNVVVRPRYMVWENVPGAFSSNGGKDFAAVLEEAIRIAEPEAPDVPVPPKGWPTAGSIVGDGWSIAWRTHDAQHWGVPQRRKRISLVADFGGRTAPEILFECKSVSRNTEPSGEERERPSEGTERSVGNSSGFDGYNGALTGEVEATLGVNCGMTTGRNGVMCLNDQGGSVMGISEDVTGALRAQEHGHQPTVYCLQGNGIDRAETAGCNGKGWRTDQSYTLNTIDRPAVVAIENHPADSRVKLSDKDLCQALKGRMGTGGGNVPMVMAIDGYNQAVTGNVSKPLTNASTDSDHIPMVMQTYQKVSGTLSPGAHAGSYNGQDAYNDMLITNCYTQGSFANYSQGCGTLKANGGDVGGGSENLAVSKKTVRRLTPLECERLQGFPDNWTNIGEWIDSKGKKHKCSDSARYKALGNSIALPFWRFLCKRISAQYARKATMASLFDGIGGFPLAWEEANGKGSAVWASEKDEFPMAVTIYHFGE